MGCGPSSPKTPEAAEIDSSINKEAKANKHVFKVLLLGTGDSGKSTFIKQMVLLHFGRFSELDAKKAINAIQENIMTGIKVLIEQVPSDKFVTAEQKTAFEFVRSKGAENSAFSEWHSHVPVLWDMPEVKETLKNQYELKVNFACGLEYFLNKFQEVCSADYVPSVDDILRARSKTTGIQEYVFKVKDSGASIRMIDVGGQRSERRKWMHHFEDIHLVVYFSALDGYAMKMDEESRTNRLQDDLALFNSLMQLVSFKKSWLFLQNKTDIFASALKKHPLDRLFPTTVPKEKGSDYDFCIKFLESKFKEKWDGEPDDLVFCQTCALDSNQMELIWTKIHKDVVGRMLHSQTGGI